MPVCQLVELTEFVDWVRKLVAVAVAAREVHALLADVLYLTHPDIAVLTDALDALDGEG